MTPKRFQSIINIFHRLLSLSISDWIFYLFKIEIIQFRAFLARIIFGDSIALIIWFLIIMTTIRTRWTCCTKTTAFTTLLFIFLLFNNRLKELCCKVLGFSSLHFSSWFFNFKFFTLLWFRTRGRTWWWRILLFIFTVKFSLCYSWFSHYWRNLFILTILVLDFWFYLWFLFWYHFKIVIIIRISKTSSSL